MNSKYKYNILTGSQKVIGSIPIFSTLKIKTLQRCKVFFVFWSAHLECPLSAHSDFLSISLYDFMYCLMALVIPK